MIQHTFNYYISSIKSFRKLKTLDLFYFYDPKLIYSFKRKLYANKDGDLTSDLNEAVLFQKDEDIKK